MKFPVSSLPEEEGCPIMSLLWYLALHLKLDSKMGVRFIPVYFDASQIGGI
jgi:hypothetical protein